MPTSAPQKLRNVNVFAASLFLDSFAKRKKHKTMWKEIKNYQSSVSLPTSPFLTVSSILSIRTLLYA
jgi:hypothetical protein